MRYRISIGMPRRVGVAFSMVTCASCAVKLGRLDEMELRFAMILGAIERVEGSRRRSRRGVQRRCANDAGLDSSQWNWCKDVVFSEGACL